MRECTLKLIEQENIQLQIKWKESDFYGTFYKSQYDTNITPVLNHVGTNDKINSRQKQQLSVVFNNDNSSSLSRYC